MRPVCWHEDFGIIQIPCQRKWRSQVVQATLQSTPVPSWTPNPVLLHSTAEIRSILIVHLRAAFRVNLQRSPTKHTKLSSESCPHGGAGNVAHATTKASQPNLPCSRAGWHQTLVWSSGRSLVSSVDTCWPIATAWVQEIYKCSTFVDLKWSKNWENNFFNNEKIFHWIYTVFAFQQAKIRNTLWKMGRKKNHDCEMGLY